MFKIDKLKRDINTTYHSYINEVNEIINGLGKEFNLNSKSYFEINTLIIEINTILTNFTNSYFFELEIIFTLVKIILILIAVAYFTIAERKAMAAIQRRRGPNTVGFYGLLQPLADGLKLLCKKLLLPTTSNKTIFITAPVIVLILSLISWSVIPFGLIDFGETHNILKNNIFTYNLIDPNFSLLSSTITHLTNHLNEVNSTSIFPYTILFILTISSLNVYGIIIAGWASNSKYAFLGALRSAAQMISYEVSIGLVLLPVALLSGTLNITKIVQSQSETGWYFLPLLPCTIIFFISMLAETNRTPFDLPEAEAELVAGYNVEYSSIIFAMFFLGEYSNMLLMSTLISLIYFGGWLIPFFACEGIFLMSFILSLKITFFCFLFILVRATLPRYKYNQLMNIGWKIFLPIALAFLCVLTSILFYFNTFVIIVENNILNSSSFENSF